MMRISLDLNAERGRGDPDQARPRCAERRHDPDGGVLIWRVPRHLRTALHNLRRAFGTWACLADAIGVKVNTLLTAARERNPVGSPGIALRAARAAGMSVESILTGAITAAGRCETCGARVAVGAERRAAGGAS